MGFTSSYSMWLPSGPAESSLIQQDRIQFDSARCGCLRVLMNPVCRRVWCRVYGLQGLLRASGVAHLLVLGTVEQVEFEGDRLLVQQAHHLCASAGSGS